MIFTSSPLRMGIARTWRGGEKTAVVEKVWKGEKRKERKEKEAPHDAGMRASMLAS